MSRAFKSSSKWVRSGLAVAAVLSTVLVMISIEGLARHYAAETHLVAGPSVIVAQR
jgi:hypothetical protein